MTVTLRDAADWRVPILAASLFAAAAPAAAAPAESADLADMSIEQLGSIEVTSVSKRAEPLSAAAASIYVITNDDIRRLGATSIPEALRLAPNLQVVRMDAQSYAISARGFNSIEASNKLLVLMDGRSVYSPLHSGVFWNAQDTMMEDVERIEVVGGPGGALWGANAVNGVINIITKAAADAPGALVSASYGTVDQTYSARYSVVASDAFAYRGYVKWADRGHSRNPNGTDHIDDWDRAQGGFRADWRGENDKATVQGDFYDGGLKVTPTQLNGQSVSFNWTHDFTEGSPLQVLAYYDRTHQFQQGVILETVNTYNVDIQQGFNIGSRQQVIWGGGYRRTQDFYDAPVPFDVVHDHAELNLANIFVQDEITLSPTVRATAGLKVEHNTYTGFEYMPNLRLAWQPEAHTLLWTSVSRAVRTPSHLDRDLEALPVLLPAPDFESETLVAYEAGYRGQFFDRVTLSVSGYYNDYQDLRTTTRLPSQTLLIQLGNGMEGHTYGVEAWSQFNVVEWWRLTAGVSALHKDLHAKPGIIDISNQQAAGNDPDYQFTLRSLMSPARDLDLDLGLRSVDSLTSPAVRGYVEMDARLGWRVAPGLELSVAGFNLLHDQHPEGGVLAARHEVRRTVQASARWAF